MYRFVVIAFSAVAVCAAADNPPIKIVEEIAAKVNGDIITRGELDRKRAEAEAEAKRQGLSGARLQDAMREFSTNVLREEIDQLLLVQKGKDLNINVDADVTRRLAEIQVQQRMPDPDKFQAFIREQTGMTFEDFKLQMKNQMLTQRVIGQEVMRNIVIPEPELQKYYEEHKKDFVREEQAFLSQILISTEGKSAEQAAAAEKKAKDLVARARKGERFPEMARDNSEASTAKGFGELPPYKKGEVAQNIEDQVWSQPKGHVTDPIRTSNGFLILKVDDHQKAGQAELSEVENEIMEKLYAPRMQPKVRDYLTELRKSAFLEIKADYVDSGAAAGKDTTWIDPAQLKPETITKAEVANQAKHKKLLWAIPIPGTKTKGTSTSQ